MRTGVAAISADQGQRHPRQDLGRRQPQRGIGCHRACHAAGIVQEAIERHTPAKAFARLMKAEATEKELWRRWRARP